MSLWNQWPVSKPKELINQVFRVVDFNRNGTTTDEHGRVHAKSIFKPYGYLTVESPESNKPIQLPIIHRDDFILATLFFDDPTSIQLWNENVSEFLVTYFPEKTDDKGFSLSPFHCLHYAICVYGTIDKYYKSSTTDPKSIFGEYVFNGPLKIRNHFIN